MRTPVQQALLQTLQTRFKQHPERHPQLTWEAVAAKLVSHANALQALHAMEATGGEPDVIDAGNGQLLFADCAAESPTGRRSLCFDRAALIARKEKKPSGSAEAMADELGIALMTEAQYRHLQTLGAFDTKTSSWLHTPAAIRALGGALFGDRRYDTVFVYHNGVQSYYAARGFRGVLSV